jgi:hypothetical protein
MTAYADPACMFGALNLAGNELPSEATAKQKNGE